MTPEERRKQHAAIELARYHANKAAINAKRKAVAQAHPERRRAYEERRPNKDARAKASRIRWKQWRKDHPELTRERDRAAYQRHRVERIARRLQWHQAHREQELERMWRNALKRAYGLTPAQYAAFGSVCHICGRTKQEAGQRRLAVDHDRKTGRVRGLLCGKCNAGIGQFNDHPKLLRNAITYLAP